MEDDRLAVVDPRAFCERGDRRLGHLRVVGEAKLLEPLDDRKAGVDKPPALAALCALGVLGLEQRGEVRLPREQRPVRRRRVNVYDASRGSSRERTATDVVNRTETRWCHH